MKTESFGTRLRTERENRRVSLAVISGQTKIKEALLEGLERDDISRWPEGIFRKAYVRAYAKAIGLDPDLTVRQFLDVYPEPVEPPPEEEQPQSRLRYLFGRLGRAEATERAAISPTVRPERRDDEIAHARPLFSGPRLERQLGDLAALCTKLGRAVAKDEIDGALEETVRLLGAVGVILWVWDSRRKAWVSGMARGYSDAVLAQLPAVSSDADNAIGSAFRSADIQIVAGSDAANGAVVAPLMTPNGCAGMLAIELQDNSEQSAVVRAFVTIVAAQLATLISIPVENKAQAVSH